MEVASHSIQKAVNGLDTSAVLDEAIEHVDRGGQVISTRRSRPFADSGAYVKDILFANHAAPALRWLLGADGTQAPAMTVGSTWEVALTLTSAIESLPYIESNPQVADKFPTLRASIQDMANWIISRAEHHHDGSLCWDHSAWDTAVTVRALSGIVVSGRDPKALAGTPELRETCAAALQWLVRRYISYYQDNVRNPLNPGELAQMGRTFVELARFEVALAQDSARSAGWPSEFNELLNSVADVLLRRRTQRHIALATRGHEVTEPCVWWEDWFGTSDVLMFFTRLLDLQDAGKYNPPPALRTQIDESMAKCFTLIEDSQADGLWGAYLDTVALLGAYVQVGAPPPQRSPDEATRSLTTQPRVVFRGLRWMCDPTQAFSDGSLLHTAFLTTFYVQTLLQIIRYWPEAKLRVIDLYDELSLIMERGITVDRANFLNASLHRDEAERALKSARTENRFLTTRISHLRWFQNRALLSHISALAIVTTATVVALEWNLLQLTIHVPDKSTLLSVLALFAALFIGLCTVIWTINRPPEITDISSE